MLKFVAGLVAIAVLAHAQVVGVGNFIHNVADLDKSIAFYRDVLGLQLQRPASTFSGPPEVLNLYNAVGGEFRVGTLVIPGTPMRIELAEFRGVDRKPVRPTSGPGTSILVFQVEDLNTVLARARAAGVKPTTPEAITVPGRHVITLPDPDGFLVQLVELVAAPDFAPSPGKAATPGGIQLTSFAYVVNDAAKFAPVFAALGLSAKKAEAFNGSLDLHMMNVAQGTLRRTRVVVPATGDAMPFLVDVIEVRGATSFKGKGRPQDPGAAVLRLLVKDEDATVRALAAAGVKVASAKGEIVTLPGGNRRGAPLLWAHPITCLFR